MYGYSYQQRQELARMSETQQLDRFLYDCYRDNWMGRKDDAMALMTYVANRAEKRYEAQQARAEQTEAG
jgi:hypothetical protein